MATTLATTAHRWRFFRAGGFDQVRIETGADLAHLHELDPKLWVALSCPIQGTDMDPQTLALIDTDGDGRIRVPEVLGAVRWALARLRNPDTLAQPADALPLAAIDDSRPDGRQLLAAARRLLASQKREGADAITVAEASNTAAVFAPGAPDGDGVVPPVAAADPALRAVIEAVIATQGAVKGRDGLDGADAASAARFFADCRAFDAWQRLAEGDAAAGIFPLGAATAEAWTACEAVRVKVDDFFGRVRLAGFDERAIAALNGEEQAYLAVAAKDLSITAAEIAAFPLARIAPGRDLPLREGVNPAWADALAAFRERTIVPLLGPRDTLTPTDWSALQARLQPYAAWQAAKAGTRVAALGLARVREILAGTSEQTLADLLAADLAVAPEAAAIAAVARLVRYRRDLMKLLTNFVNFRDFYDPAVPAVFQAGTLYLDQRGCELCLAVTDAAKHAALAGLARTFLAYCDCTRSGSKLSIVAAFTDGDSDNLMVGRNGLFVDSQGRDWDATIVRIVENPIGIRQAFWSPYKKFVRFLEEQVAKRAAAAETSSTAQIETAATSLAAAGKAAPAAGPRKFDVGTVAALGVGLGAIATMVGGFVAGFLALHWWQMPLALLGLMLVISLPSVVIAWLKLRQRNLGPILDASGWAVNTRARLNIPFGASLTQTARLPPGAERSLHDPFADRRSPWPARVIALVVLAALAWYLHRQGWLACPSWLSPAAPEAAAPAAPTAP